MQQTENLNIEAFDLLPTPEEVHSRLPLSDAAAESVLTGRRACSASSTEPTRASSSWSAPARSTTRWPASTTRGA